MGERLDEGNLLAEVRRVVERTRELIVSVGETPSSAYSHAYTESCARRRHLGSTAGIIAGWLIDSSGSPQDPLSADRALALLDTAEGDPGLSAAVHRLVRDVAAGEISDADFLAVTRRPWRDARAKVRPQSRVATSAAVEVADAAKVLKGMLREAGVDPRSPEPYAVWTVFKAFAECPARTADGVLQHDVCLFQWGVYDGGRGEHFEWDMTRQFTLADANGDYDHMEQLHCTLLFNVEPRLSVLGTGDCWSGDDVGEWTREVEALEGFSIPPTVSQPVGLQLVQERV